MTTEKAQDSAAPTGAASALSAGFGACEVPLVEKLRSIPKDYRTSVAIQWAEDGRETGHRFIPVGYMMHEAADEIEALQYSLRLDEELIGKIQQVISVLASRPVVTPNADVTGPCLHGSGGQQGSAALPLY